LMAFATSIFIPLIRLLRRRRLRPIASLVTAASPEGSPNDQRRISGRKTALISISVRPMPRPRKSRRRAAASVGKGGHYHG
jgi:hypothetical protein